MEFDPKILENEEVRTKVVSHLSESGFVVKSKDDYSKSLNDFLTGLSHEDERVKHIAGPIVRKEREAVEGIVTKHFPDAKKLVLEDGKTEPAVAYAERVFTSKLKELEALSKKGVTNEQLVKDFDDFKTLASTKEKTLSKKIEELNATLLQKDITFDIGKSIAKREGRFSNDEKIKSLIPEIVNSVQRQASELKSEYRTVGDKKVLALLDDNGSVKMNPKTGNFMTMDEWIEEKLSPVMEVGKVQPGAGTGADANKQGSVPIPDTIKNQQQLQAYMEKELKLDMTKKEVIEQYNKIIKERGLKLF